MSEYQYYEWQTIDRVLSPAEQSEVNELSSHIEVSPSNAIVTYEWGDFKHDPYQVLLDYFDAHFYLANWGSVRLMFRFPKGMVEETEVEAYCDDESVSFVTDGDYQVLDIEFDLESSDWLEFPDVDLSDFVSLRAALLQGDYRLLYLAWLKKTTLADESIDEQEDDEDNPIHYLEPPIPAGLNNLIPALHSFMRTFNIDPFVVQAAAEASPDLRPPESVNYQEWITHLTREECNDYLTLLAEGDPAVGMVLRKRLGEFIPKDETTSPEGKRTLGDLVDRARQLKEAEGKRQAKEARLKHIAAMKAMAEKEPQIWQEVDRLLESSAKSATTYDRATAVLVQLKQLSEFQDTRDVFHALVRQLANKYVSRPSLLNRWREKGWI